MTEEHSATIWLPYDNQGNVKATLQSIIEKLQKIHDVLPHDNKMRLNGNGHYINMTGDKASMELLKKQDLLSMPNHGRRTRSRFASP
jgi:hypothetical protein